MATSFRIQVRFVSYQYKRWMRAADRLKATAFAERDDLPRRMSIDYIDTIRKYIYTNRFGATYSRYNRRYRQWKYMIFKSSGGFWHLKGDLVTALQSKWRKSTTYTSTWFGGIPSNAYDSGGKSWLGTGNRGRKMSIAQYANWMEYGRAGQPSRPLFRPTLIEYASGKGTKRLSESRQRLLGRWK